MPVQEPQTLFAGQVGQRVADAPLQERSHFSVGDERRTNRIGRSKTLVNRIPRFVASETRKFSRVNDTQDGFSGPFKTDFIGSDGQVLASSSGSVEGTRMQVEGLG